MKLKLFEGIILTAFILFTNEQELLTQTLIPNDSLFSGNKSANLIEYGVDKIVNTYAFKGNVDFLSNLSWGNLNIRQIYSGKAMTSGFRSFWDDEIFLLGCEIFATKKLFVKVNQNLTYYSTDIETQSKSQIGQLRSTGGLKYQFLDNFYIESNAGYEKNKQRDIIGEGSVFNLKSNLNNYELEDYFLNANALAEYISLNDGRKKSLFDLRGNLFRNFDERNSLRIDARYKSFLYPVALSDVGKNSIKSRLEDNIYLSLNFNFGLSESISGSIGMIADNKNVSHSYNRFYEGYKTTAIETNRNELNMYFTGELFYQSNKFFQSFGMSYLPKNERNSTNKKFDISDNDFFYLQNEEKKLDNVSTNTQLKARTVYLLSKRDSLSAYFFVSLYRYDTPSDEINDDRDELTNLFNVRYSRKFSDILSASIIAEVQMIHYVYIDSTRSADNNWYRLVKLGPSINISTKKLSLNPALYISSNYLTYDFEDISPNIDSYSIREMGYQDSIYIYLTQRINLQAKLKVRYYEQGILFWNSFSETPQSSNYEHFVQALFYYEPFENLTIGSGLRFFELKQKNLGIYALNNIGIEHYSFAPETVIRYKASESIYFDIRAWYEFQKTNRDLEYKEIPNLLMVTRINI